MGHKNALPIGLSDFSYHVLLSFSLTGWEEVTDVTSLLPQTESWENVVARDPLPAGPTLRFMKLEVIVRRTSRP